MRTSVSARRRAARGARWLAAVALGTLAVLGAATAAQAQPAAAAAPLPKPQPIALNLLNWSGSAGFGSRGPAWYQDSSGVVHLQGAVKVVNETGPNAPLIGTLPRAAWPAQFVLLLAHSFDGTYASLEISPAGQITAVPSAAPAVTDFSFVSLEGLTYRPTGDGTPIAMNTVNWNGSVAGTFTPSWYTDRSGIVHLEGAADQASTTGSGANTIGTLPPAEAPAQAVYTVVTTGQNAYADLVIQPSGAIDLIGARPPAVEENYLVSLESISYRPAGAGSPIAVNTANFSGSAGFGSRPPAWYTDKYGIVHLQGAVTQTSTSGSGANTIGTLPPAARPSHDVYTIVHTFNGTYADLVIQPSGAIDLINPRPPMVGDYSFVSLESISYRR
jgi:hypothetical protein